jgi:hypothetical protein
MKHLVTAILEFVLSQPAHRLPAVFTPATCPLPDCSESPEDVFDTVLKLNQQELIKAHVTRGVHGAPCQAEVQYVTLAGRIHLENRLEKTREKKLSERVAVGGGLAVIAILVVVGVMIFGLFRGPRSSSPGPQHADLPKSTAPAEPPAPAATPSPITTPATIPASLAAASPTITPGRSLGKATTR